MTSDDARTRLKMVLIANAVELIEESGPLDDEQAMAQAFRMHTGQQERLLERAWILGKGMGLDLDRELERWKTLQWFVGIALCLIVYISWGGLIAPFARPDRPINAVIALVTVLLVPTLIFFLWLIAVFRQLFTAGSAGPFLGGHVFLGLLAWIPLGRTKYTEFLARGALAVLQKNRLSTWIFGLLSHVFWSVLLLLVLLTLRVLFEFEGYDLYWKTTTGDRAAIDGWIRVFGQLPVLLGFPGLASESLTLNATAGEMQSYALGWWVMGCTFAYGLLPRLVALAICWWVVQKRKGRVQLDTQDPYFQKILVRFDAMETASSEDLENPFFQGSQTSPARHAPDHRLAFVLIGFELPHEHPWPPHLLGAQTDTIRRISGSFDERRTLLNELASGLPRCVILVCDAASSPDRGTERVLREVCGYADRVGVWPAASTPSSEVNPSRWSRWLATLEFKNLHCVNTEKQALQWLDECHDQTH